MGEAIVITSGKGGVGKTTTTANIGAGLAKMEKRVVMVDTDIGLRNLDVVAGLENWIVYHLVDVVEGRCSLDQALIHNGKYPNLFMLPSAQSRDKSAVTSEQMEQLVGELKAQFDYVLLDCPAGIEQGFLNAIAGADRSIVVTAPGVASVRDADRIVGLLEQHQITDNRVLVNRIRMNLVARGDMMTVDDICAVLGIPLIGVVPDDENVLVCANRGTLVVGTDCPAGKAFADTCRRVTGEDVPFEIWEPEEEETGRAARRKRRKERREQKN